jgi:hypothetical protein
MPFLATCPFCPAKFQLSRKALGGSVCCPECGNYFTAVPPEEEAPQLGTPAMRALAAKKRAAASAPPVAAVTTEESLTAPGADHMDQIPPPPPVIRTAEEVVSPSTMPAPIGTPVPGWINIWGLAALLLGGLALFFAAVSPWFMALRHLTIPFAGLGLAASVLGFLASLDDRKIKDVIWLGLGGVVSLAVLVIAIFWGNLLNPYWGRDFAVAPAYPNKPMQVGLKNPTVGRDLPANEWVDASKAAYRNGDVFIKIMEVKVDQAPLAPPLKDKAAMKSLLIYLKVANLSQLRMIPYTGQASGKHPATLKDAQGKTVNVRNFPAGSILAGQTKQAVVRANKQVDDLLVFEPPPADVKHLDLELPAAAWGGTGTCKLRIPASMITFAHD